MNNEFNLRSYYGESYKTFNDNIPTSEKQESRIMSVEDGKISLQPMWRMEMFGKYYGIDIYQYEDDTNYEYYDEVLWQLPTEQQRRKFRKENYHPDTFDDYYEDLALIAQEVGDERSEIKCLIKSLLNKYRLDTAGDFHEFPHKPFNKLYYRLTESKDIDQIRAAQRLARYHIDKLNCFLQNKAQSKIWKLTPTPMNYKNKSLSTQL